MSTVSREHLRAYRLWRSYLLPERQSPDIHEVVRHCIALTATNIHSAYLALFNRVQNFTRQSFDDYLYKSGMAGRLRGMRRGLYVIPREHFELIFSGTYRHREYTIKENLNICAISEAEYTKLARHIMKTIASCEKTRTQLKKTCAPHDLRTIEKQYARKNITSTNFDSVFNTLLDRWQVIPGMETWDMKKTPYCSFDVYHSHPKFSLNRETVERELVLQYIKSYGPVEVENIAWWCDLTVNRVMKILASLSNEVREIEISKKIFYVCLHDVQILLSLNVILHDFCLLLGQDDPLLTGYRSLNEFITKEHYNTIFLKTGESLPVVLIDGKIAGTWRFKESKSLLNVTISLFYKLNPKKEDKLCKEIERMGDFLGGEDATTTVEIIYS